VTDLRINSDMLECFESGFDPRRPKRCAIPARVLAHGKGCTILVLEHPEAEGLVFKRMAIFHSETEAERYEALLHTYIHTLSEDIGIQIVPCATAHVRTPVRDHWAVYIIQQRMPEAAIGHTLIASLPPDEMNRLTMAALEQTAKVFDFNRAHLDQLELGIDGRISNWAVAELDPANPALSHRVKLYYLDVGTPLMRRAGVEQYEPTPLLRSFPAVMRPFVRRAFLPDLMTRYYDFRRVTLDLLSSILKEGYAEFLPMLADSVNWFFLAERQEMHFQPLTVQEIVAYHRRDAWLWRAYLTLRRSR